MNTTNGFGVFLILIFAGLFLFVIFLLLKQRNKGILGNKLLLGGAIVALVVVFLVVKGTIISAYQSAFKAAPYDFSELKSFVFKYGPGDSLINQYNSETGEYQYLNKRDSLVKTHLYLTSNDLIYLHRKAVELGFWDFPSNEKNADTSYAGDKKPFEFFIQYNYKHKSKTVLFSTNYGGSQELMEANRTLITDIQTVLSKAEERQKK